MKLRVFLKRASRELWGHVTTNIALMCKKGRSAALASNVFSALNSVCIIENPEEGIPRDLFAHFDLKTYIQLDSEIPDEICEKYLERVRYVRKKLERFGVDHAEDVSERGNRGSASDHAEQQKRQNTASRSGSDDQDDAGDDGGDGEEFLDGA